MAARNPQTFAKRARKAEAAALKAEGIEPEVEEHDAENLNDPRNTSTAVMPPVGRNG